MKSVQDIGRKEYSMMASENVRLTNLLAEKDSQIKFLEEENTCLVSELNEGERLRLDLEQQVLQWKSKYETEHMSAEEVRVECESLKSRVSEFESLAKDAGTDYESVINVIRRRQFNTNSDATRYLNGEVGVSDARLSGLDLNGLVREIMDKYVDEDSSKKRDEGKIPYTPREKRGRGSVRGVKKPRRVYTEKFLSRMGIDTSNLPPGSKLIRRKKEDGSLVYDEWVIVVYDYIPGQVGRKEYVVGRFNVPGEDPKNSKGPALITEGAYITAAFARFYFVSKIEFGLSESRILKMFKSMHADIPQSTLNKWVHKIMRRLKNALEGPMLEEIRKSTYTQNDETRIDVRSIIDGKESYHTEYIHGCISTERKLVVMLYEEGSRSSEVQLKNIFKNSSIEFFTSDRAALYGTIENCMLEYGVIRTACWFHARHKLVDAYTSDKRVGPIIEMINTVFIAEGEYADKPVGMRHKYRQKYILPIIDAIMRRLKAIRNNIGQYGTLVQKAVNYILDDEQAFRMFLTDGRIMIHNNAAERMFRHIAMGRRNWLHSGSHEGASNIAFMYSLFESCKLNGLNFGDYLEDILNRIAEGDTDYESMIACNYKPRKKSSETKAA